MRRRLPGALAAVGLVVVLGLPDPATAATKSVQEGLPSRWQHRFRAISSDVNAYFPSIITVHQGDAIRFLPGRPQAFGSTTPSKPNVGFHTIDLPQKGGRPVALAVPTGERASSTDAAGAQFWFRGSDVFRLNPRLLIAARPGVLRYDGSRRVISGVPTTPKPKPLTVRFAKVGSFRYFCNLHPGMSGTVRVLPAGREVPTLAADGRTVDAQARSALRVAVSLAHLRPAPRVVSIGQAGTGGVERYAFSPSALTVMRGRTLTFAVPPGSWQAHTASTGPGDPSIPGDSYLGKLAASFASPTVDPRAANASDPPTVGAVSLTSHLHGNGFWNSGVLDGQATTAIPEGNSVLFSQRGTFRFYCLIHPFMHTTISVR